tara:strand:- start:429 stop:2351 length:1923 start_codon:yes stop_codon:yes gene_type:complete
MANINSKLTLDNSQFQKSAKASKTLISGLGKGLAAVGGAAKVAAAGVTVATGALVGLIAVNARTIDRLGKVAKTTGFAADTLQKFQFAAEQTGVTSDNAALALRRFSRRLGEAQKGSGELLPALKKLGIQTRDNNGNLKTAEQVLFEFADGISKTTNESEALALAFKAFDSEGAELVNVLRDGSAGLNEFFDEAERLGFILTKTSIEGVERFNDEMNKLKLTVGGLGKQFTAALAPVLEKLATQFTNFIVDTIAAKGGMEEFGKYLKDQFLTIVQTVIKTFVTLYNVIVQVVNGIQSALSFLGIGGEVANLKKNIEELREESNKAGWWTRFNAATGETARILKEEMGSAFLLTDENIAKAIAILEKRVTQLQATGQGGSLLTPISAEDLMKTLQFVETYKEEVKSANKEVYNEIVTVGQKIAPTLLDIMLDALFPKQAVDKFFDTYDNAAASTAEKIKAAFVLVGDAINIALPNLKDKFINSGVGDFVTTLEDGLVKAGQMLEDSLATAIATGKADFTSLGDHIKQVLAKAMVQKFISIPIMKLFGLTGLASGGPAKAGQPYLVGEEGMEVFVPKTAGTVIPNDQTMDMMNGGGGAIGGGTTHVTYNISALDSRSWKQMLAQDPEYMFNLTQAGRRRLPV